MSWSLPRRRARPAPDSLNGAAALATPAMAAPLDEPGSQGPGPTWWRRLSGSSDELLVLDVGPTGAQLSLMRGGAPGVDTLCLGQAHDPGTDPDRVLPALLQRLRDQGLRPPRRLALSLAGAVLGTADLPVDPQRPRAPSQMGEMVRYEVEPAVAAHNSLWSVGEVLAARGALDAATRARIASGLARGQVNEFGDPLRFGELGMAQQWLERHALDEALAAQQDLQVLDTELACGWHGELLRDAQGHRTPHWRLAAMSQALRERWLVAAKGQGLRLLGLWPSAGLSLLHAAAPAGTTLALEVLPEQLLALRLVDARVAGWRSEPRQERTLNASLLADVLAEWQVEPLTEVLLVVADGGEAEPLAAALQRLLRVPVRLLADTASASAARRAGVLAREQALAPPKRQALAIPVRDPRPALWQRPALRPWFALLAVLVGLVAWQAQAWREIWRLQADTARMAEVQRRSSGNAQEQQQLTVEAQQLDAEADQLRDALGSLNHKLQGMALIVERQRTVPGLIRALGQAIDDRVVLDAIVESRDPDVAMGLQVRAWSPAPDRLQAYAARVAQGVAPLGLAVAQSELAQRRGRMGTPGHQISFWLVPEPAELAQVPAEPASAPAALTPAASATAREGLR